MNHLLPSRLKLLLLAVIAVWPGPGYPAQNVQLVLHPPPYLQKLQLNEVRAIFTMRVKSWPGGTDITVFVLPDHDELHQRFVKHTLQLLPHQLRRHWNRLVYTGIGRAPTEVESAVEMRQKLLTTPGSIGYLPHSNTTGGDHDGLIYLSLD